MMRINKRMADLKMASRREADTLIARGMVQVNGKPAQLGMQVTEHDHITISGKLKEYKYFAYYKPRGVITHAPAPHEIDIASAVSEAYGITDVYPVGRLDKDSEGLIILTNDGRLTTMLVGETSEVEKEYEVLLDKAITPHLLTQLERGVDIEGYITKPAITKKLSATSLSLTLTEGKKHQIRRMSAALGYQVQKLTRVRIGAYTLKNRSAGSLTPISIDDLIT